jgi:signal transduction histidine kinase
VSDTGIGIAPLDVARVFERFVQLEHGSRISREGTGIGLSVTKSLVELHGATIRAESEGSGRGSTFTLTLPLGATPNGFAAPAELNAGPG